MRRYEGYTGELRHRYIKTVRKINRRFKKLEKDGAILNFQIRVEEVCNNCA